MFWSQGEADVVVIGAGLAGMLSIFLDAFLASLSGETQRGQVRIVKSEGSSETLGARLEQKQS